VGFSVGSGLLDTSGLAWIAGVLVATGVSVGTVMVSIELVVASGVAIGSTFTVVSLAFMM
jgi:hypothetical protein